MMEIAKVWTRGIDGNDRPTEFIAPIDEDELKTNQWVEYVNAEIKERLEWDYELNALQVLLK